MILMGNKKIFGVDAGRFPTMEDDFFSALHYTVERGMPPPRSLQEQQPDNDPDPEPKFFEEYQDDQPSMRKEMKIFETERLERVSSGEAPLQEDIIFMQRFKGRPMRSGNIFGGNSNKIAQNIFGDNTPKAKGKGKGKGKGFGFGFGKGKNPFAF